MPTTRPIGHSRRSVHVAAVLLAATLPITAACATEEPDNLAQSLATSAPQETETSPAFTPTATPAEIASEDADIGSPPVLPDAAKENTVEGAISFAGYYVNLWNYSATSLQPTILEEVSETSCTWCTDFIEFLDDLRAENANLVDYEIKPLSELRKAIEHNSAVGFELDFNEQEYSIVRPTGSYKVASQDTDGAIVVVFLDGKWKTAQFGKRVK